MAEEEDRISKLPEQILHHHILSLLPQEDAVRTCILSKSWRHLGPTRPKFEFDESSFRRKRQQLFLPAVKNTLQRYADQNLQIQEFILRAASGSESISLLDEWVPKIITNFGAKTFKLTAYSFSVPSVVFQAELLVELYLKHCKLDQINNCIVKLRGLKILSLHSVSIEDETFEKIMTSCPLIQHLVLDSCLRLRTVKVNKAHNLKHFECQINGYHDGEGSIEIDDDDDAPSLETIYIMRCWNWKNKNNYIFPRLKSLYLRQVYQPITELLNNLSSNNCPCLESLELDNCPGFSEFKLSSRSIKSLTIDVPYHQMKFDIDAANMLYFECRGGYVPSISFATTTSRDWESRIEASSEWCSDSTADVKSTWCLELNEFLKALSQSRISLDISRLCWTNQDTTCCGGICEPAVVEQLCLSGYHSSDELPVLFNHLFRICRPRYVGPTLSDTDSMKRYQRQFAESIWKTLVNKGGTRQRHFWQHELEEPSIQVLDENTNEWLPVHVREFSINRFSINQSIRFLLKWRN